MNLEYDISVIIVNYNVKDFLFQCLRSVESAIKNLRVELIVVDNNSSDQSVEFIQPLFPNVKFLSLKENIGFAKANNLGFAESKGKYILILNPDTIMEENTLETMYNYLENNSDTGCAGCKVLNSDGSFQLACRRGFPTPWASFCKLFGLQSLFPKFKLFGKYNQTFKSVDETYNIEAIMGAFMFFRREALAEAQGFDPEFFMYGEDLDLCYRLIKKGWKITYIHSTSIIHYKGESTRRSSINEIKLFYDAMKIFSKKHYSGSALFLIFLKLGILLRSFIAYGNKYKRDIFIISSDVIGINLSLMFSTLYRFGGLFNFPDYAYPSVFIAVTFVLFVSMAVVGEYFESKQTIRRALFGFLVSFFILSSMTYYFKDYAFSRGVLLMTIGLSGLWAIFIRSILSLIDKTKGVESDKHIVIVGINKHTENIINSIRKSELRNVRIAGVIRSQLKMADGIKLKENTSHGQNIIEDRHLPKNDKEFVGTTFCNVPIIGNVDFLPKIIEQYNIREVIITDTFIDQIELIKIVNNSSNLSARFHIAHEYEELLVSRIINEITGNEPTIPFLTINILRFKVLKRLFDIISSLFLLTIGLPVLYLLSNKVARNLKLLLNVLVGKYSIVGIYDEKSKGYEEQGSGIVIPASGKPGITGLVHISNPEQLSLEAIRNLNLYYRQYYSFSLDIDIILKFLFRKRNGSRLGT